MNVMNFTDARNGLKGAMDSAILDRDPVIITRSKGEAAVLMSLNDYNSIQETFHLLGNPRNAERLRQSIVALDAGKGIERDLIDGITQAPA